MLALIVVTAAEGAVPQLGADDANGALPHADSAAIDRLAIEMDDNRPRLTQRLYVPPTAIRGYSSVEPPRYGEPYT